MGRFVVRSLAAAIVGISVLASQAGLASASPVTRTSGASASARSATGVTAQVAPPRRARVLRLKDVPKPLGVLKVAAVGRSAAKAGMKPAATGAAAALAAPFSQCPAIGNDTSCGILVNVTNGGSQILADPAQGPYDGSDDTLIGVLNSSGSAVGSLTLSSGTNPFGFDGDGICTFSGWAGGSGCPYDSTGYAGPGTSFTSITPDGNGGVVILSPALQPGQSAYFSLEEPLAGSQVTAGGPTTAEQGSGANPSERPTTCSTDRPVNCATGVFWHQFADFSVPGRGVALDLTRTYSSSQAGTDGPFGFGWTDSYGMSLAVDQATGDVTVTQEDGSPVTFLPNGSGGFTAPPRVLAVLVPGSDGSYTFIRSGSQVQYTFSATGQLVKAVDRNGYLTSLAYNGSGQLATVTDPAGRTLTFGYAGSHVTSVTDPMGRAWGYAYDGSGNLVSATDPLGRTWSYTYDPGHLMLSMTDPRGGATSNTYNSSGQVVRQADPNGGTTTFTWSGDPASSAGATNTMTDPNGNVTQYQYANMELGSVTRAFGTSAAATTSYTYDPATLGVTTVTDPAGHVTTSGYDSLGNLLTTTNPDGGTASYGYNGFNEVSFRKTPNGELTSYSYDGAGNLTSVSDPLGTTSYAYGDSAAPGDVTSMTNPDGNVTDYAYDSDGDLASATVTPSAGVTDTISYAYDADGERTCEATGNATASGISCPAAGTAPVPGTTATAYDADGEVTAVTDPLGHVTSYAYDEDGNKVKVTDAAGHVTQYAYDPGNRQVKVTQADGTTLTTAYDADGNPVKQVNAAGAATTYSYNALNQVTSAKDPLGHATAYGYDAAGNRTSVQDPQGQVTTYGYDTAGLETAISYSDGKTPGVSYVYDADGRRTSMTDGTGTTSYAYDGDGHVTSVTNGAGSAVSYSYDAAGLLTSLTYPDGQDVSRAYDGAARLASIADGLGHTTTFSYDHDGNLTSKAYPNGVTASSAFDAADQLTGLTDKTASATLASYAYTRDSLGQVTAAAETGAGAASQGYSYTQLSQLASDSAGSYGDDPAGNLTGQPGGVTQSYNADGQLTSGTYPAAAAAPATDQVASAAALPGSPVAPVADRSVSATQASKGASVTSPGLTTRGTGELILALVSANGPAGKAQQVTAVSGGGLSWHLVTRADGQQGTAEVWQAYAARVVSNARVTARFRYQRADGAITVTAFRGARGAAGAHAAASRPSGAPAVSLTTTAAQSVVWGVGEDPLHATARTVVPGQALVYDSVDARGRDTFWSQRTGAIARAKTVVKVADSKPAGDRWNLAAVEIPAATPAVPPVTSPAVTTKSGGELVLAFVSANGPAGKAQQVTAVSGGGLTWSRVAQANGQQGAAEVWQASATAVLSGVKVTAALAFPGYRGAITVATFTGAGQAAGAHAAASGASGAPSASLTTTAADSVVWGVGEDPFHATARTPAPGQALASDSVDAAGSDTFWSQALTAPVAASGSPVQVADTAPAAGQWNLAAVEITPAAAGMADVAYGYNADGDLTSVTPAGKAATSLSYDQASRLTGYGSGATYAYDGDGLRMSKTVGAATTAFAWDQSGTLPLLLTAGTVNYVYGPGGTPIEQVDTASSNAVSYLLSDQQGSTRLITDASGAVTGTYAYGSYGTVARHTGAATTDLQYDAQYTDAESGLQYLRARYYNPATGQFITVDPLVTVTGEPYGFTAGNPVSAFDPSGLSWYNPMSWTKKTWETVATVSAGVAIGAGLVAVCVASVVCAGTAAAAFTGASTVSESLAFAEIAGNAAAVAGTGAAVVGGIADVRVAAYECPGHWTSGRCLMDGGQLLIDAVVPGLGSKVVEDTIWKPVYDTLTSIGAYGYGKLKDVFFPEESPCERGGW